MAKKAAPKAAEAKAAPAPKAAAAEKKVKPRTKAELYAKLAETSGLSKKQVATVFEQLAEVIKADLSKKGPGQFVVPGLIKLKVAIKPATKAGMKKNPFTGEMQQQPAKPASRTVRARPLKALKDMVV